MSREKSLDYPESNINDIPVSQWINSGPTACPVSPCCSTSDFDDGILITGHAYAR
jgi:hypothetical protein